MIKFEKLPFEIKNTFICSDTHYNHANICRGTSKWDDPRKTRNFSTIDLMNQAIVDGINSTVGENDLLFHLGDWSFGGKDNIPKLRERIVCKNIILIKGNHDHWVHEYPDLFLNIFDIGYFQIDYIKLVLCHYPMLFWHEQNKGSIHLFGHLHGNENEQLKFYKENYKMFDCGIDVAYSVFNQYKPFSLEYLSSVLKDKEIIERH